MVLATEPVAWLQVVLAIFYFTPALAAASGSIFRSVSVACSLIRVSGALSDFNSAGIAILASAPNSPESGRSKLMTLEATLWSVTEAASRTRALGSFRSACSAGKAGWAFVPMKSRKAAAFLRTSGREQSKAAIRAGSPGTQIRADDWAAYAEASSVPFVSA